MSRGGDRRPIDRSHGRDLSYAYLLLNAMCEDASEAGRRFNREREAIFVRWERLLRVLSNYPVAGYPAPPRELDRICDYLRAASNARPTYYPKPRVLTPEEETIVQRRREAADRTLQEQYVELKSYEGVSASDYNRKLEAAYASHQSWVDEVWIQANPGRRLRTSKISLVRKYREDMEAFCLRWYLNAWWAVPALVQSYFWRIETGRDGLLDYFATGFHSILSFPIVANLPGASDGAPCVVVEWDDLNRYPSRYDPAVEVTISIHVVQECEARLDRRVTKRERRAIVKQVAPQLGQAHRRLLDSDFHVAGNADLQSHARWTAKRLLYPEETWDGLFPDVNETRGLRRACSDFASKAQVELPASPRGRPLGHANILH